MNPLKKLGLTTAVAMGLLISIGATSASATTLEIGGVGQNKSVTLELSQSSGTSTIFKDEFGTTLDTCAASSLKGSTSSSFSGATVSGLLTTLLFANCTHTTHVIKNGSFSISWSSGTNGILSSSGAEITVQSTAFGTSCVLKTGSGAALGTVTGVKSGNATVDVNALISGGICGLSRWTGTYTVTNPTGLGVVS